MHYHTVLFRFGEQTSEAEIDGVLEHLQGLRAIPAVRSIGVGPNLMPVTKGWSHGMILAFDTQQAMMEEFGPHPLHQAVLRDDAPLFADSLSLDLWVGPR